MSDYIKDIIKIQYVREGYLPNIPYHMITDREMIDAFLTKTISPIEDVTVDTLPYVKGYFIDTYPCPDDSLLPYYIELINSLRHNLCSFEANGKGDVNQDGKVNELDVKLITEYYVGGYDIEISEAGLLEADMDNNGTINLRDATLLKRALYTDWGAREDINSAIIPDWVYSYMLGIVVGPNSSIYDRHNLLTLLGVDNTYDIFDKVASERCYAISQKYIVTNKVKRVPTIFGEPHIIKQQRLLEI